MTWLFGIRLSGGSSFHAFVDPSVHALEDALWARAYLERTHYRIGGIVNVIRGGSLVQVPLAQARAKNIEYSAWSYCCTHASHPKGQTRGYSDQCGCPVQVYAIKPYAERGDVYVQV